jgi:hypothetical protein
MIFLTINPPQMMIARPRRAVWRSARIGKFGAACDRPGGTTAGTSEALPFQIEFDARVTQVEQNPISLSLT